MPISKRIAKQQPTPTELKPYWRSECGRAVVYVGDCRIVMSQMEPEQFHAVVTDPPYDLTIPRTHTGFLTGCKNNSHGKVDNESRRSGFMGKKWDGTGVAFDRTTWEGVLQVVKPGAHLLSFGGTRTWHRMTCAIEDAGFEIRDTIMWVYGSGFPKSLDVSKAINKRLGAEHLREFKSKNPADRPYTYTVGETSTGWCSPPRPDKTSDATDEARQWEGFGTALKPGHEPIVLARKPLIGTVAQCVMEHGTGALNIDGCRIGVDQVGWGGKNGFQNTHEASNHGGLGSPEPRPITGRWPANFIHDGSDEVVSLFPITKPTKPHGGDGKLLDTRGEGWGFKRMSSSLSDIGGSAARYFYTAKADEDDRPHGKTSTSHPTVKPLDLMRYLVRLVTPSYGVVLDPFMGSGSTGCAAILEGMRFVGIEQSAEYADLAVGRLKLALAESGGSTNNSPLPPKKLRGFD